MSADEPRNSQGAAQTAGGGFAEFADTPDLDEATKGRGAWITWGVLASMLALVLVVAWHLDAFWWQ